jgi:hypothetical protein
MSDETERFWYPFTATTVIARRLAPLLLFTLGVGLLIWAGREFYYWQRPGAMVPPALLALLSWGAAAYFFTLLPEVRADNSGLSARRWGVWWRQMGWDQVAGVEATARADLLGWQETIYTVYRWRTVRGRRGRVRRAWHRQRVPAFRFSGHIRNGERLMALIEEKMVGDKEEGRSDK